MDVTGENQAHRAHQRQVEDPSPETVEPGHVHVLLARTPADGVADFRRAQGNHRRKHVLVDARRRHRLPAARRPTVGGSDEKEQKLGSRLRPDPSDRRR